MSEIRVTRNGNPIVATRKGTSKAVLATAIEIETAAKVLAPVAIKFGGTLRDSIRSVLVTQLVAAVSANTFYAPYVEFGTRKMAAQPYMRPAVGQARERARKAAQRVLVDEMNKELR